MKIIAAAILVFCSAIAYACDNPIGEAIWTLQPGQTQTVQWNFSDCWFGINGWTIYVTQPRNKNGYAAALPPNTALTITVADVTTNETYSGNSFIVPFLNENCSKDVMLLNLTYTGKKPLSVLVGTYGNLGGAP
jgi:hypothetical protein